MQDHRKHAANDRADSHASEAAALQRLLGAVAAGDMTAFAEFYDRTSARVHGVTRNVLRDTGYAEETTQEVYLQVWRSADRFDPAQGTAMSWLITIAHRRAVDRLRSEQAQSDRTRAYVARTRSRAYDEVTDTVLQRAERTAVRENLSGLTPTERESLVRAYYFGRTYREVADDLGVALPTVKSRIRNALIRLRTELAPL